VNQEEIRQVWLRAQSRCEYCHLFSSDHPLPFHVDHIIARQHGGQTVLDNLALSCLHCNRHKGPNIAGFDAITGEPVRLFNPRQDRWADHFEWAQAELVGKTLIGRITIQVLAMNDPDFVAVREAIIRERTARL
jgi:hypothetical protein